ncbi:MAG: P-II family nitrogen regulator [Thaumarchaeota archaeon]|nr:P-II family nitrogen regulator [Nitrososphaerota archaeon]
MIRIEAVVGQGDIKAISDGLKKIHVGGITVMKVRGRGKSSSPKLHAAKGTEIFVPEFNDKYIVQVIVEEKNETEVISIVKNNAKIGKIFISPVTRAIDIASSAENEKAI